MNKINTDSWKRFHLYDDELFNIDSGNKFDKSKMKQLNDNENGICFVGRSSVNNGITCIVEKFENTEPYKAGNMTIALGGEYLGSCFIQKKDFYTSQNVNVLIPKWDMSEPIKLFLSYVIFKESRMYYKAFENELNKHMNTDFSILLPVKDDDTIDFDYMENYMKNIKTKARNKIDKLKSIKGNKTIVNTKEWKEFYIKDIFITQEFGKEIQVPTGSWVSSKDLKSEGSVPRITAKGIDNGIIGFYDSILENTNYRVYKNFLSVSFLGDVFYQEGEASLDMKIHCLKPKDFELNKYIALFLIPIIKKSLSKYSYGDQISSKLLPNIKISLPTKSDNTIDFEYMEIYMKNLEIKAQSRIDNFKNI